MNIHEVAFVIDIETYDTRPTARVATIGVVAVDLVTGEVLDAMHIPISAQDQPFRTQSDSTMRWWASQPMAAQDAAFGLMVPRLSGYDALLGFGDFIRRITGYHFQTPRTFGVWGYGASFDVVVLESLYCDFHVDPPWTYRQHRDLRTLYELAGIKLADFVEPGETQHNALDDAKAEARAMLAALERLGHRFALRPEAPTAEAVECDVA